MQRAHLKLFLLLFCLALPGAAFAQTAKTGAIVGEGAFARAMVPGAKVGGGYLTIVNHGPDDRLTSVTSDRAGVVQLHEMKMKGDVMEMHEMKNGVAIPAGATVTFKPGGYHLMFLKVPQPFRQGETVKATLHFQKAGAVEVQLPVGSFADKGPAMQHDGKNSHMDHMKMEQAQ